MSSVLPERRRIPGVVARPGAVREDDGARRARAIVFGQQGASERGADAEQLEVVAGDDLAQRHARLVAAFDRRDGRAVGRHPREDRVLLLEIEEVGVGAGRVGVAVAASRVDVNHPVGPLDRQRPQQRGIHDRKESGREANPDGERGDRHEGERRAAHQPFQRVADVGTELLEEHDCLIRGSRAQGSRSACPRLRKSAGHRGPQSSEPLEPFGWKTRPTARCDAFRPRSLDRLSADNGPRTRGPRHSSCFRRLRHDSRAADPRKTGRRPGGRRAGASRVRNNCAPLSHALWRNRHRLRSLGGVWCSWKSRRGRMRSSGPPPRP